MRSLWCHTPADHNSEDKTETPDEMHAAKCLLLPTGAPKSKVTHLQVCAGVDIEVTFKQLLLVFTDYLHQKFIS